MSSEPSYGRPRNLLLLGWVVVPAALLLGVLIYLLLGGGETTDSTTATTKREEENFLSQIRTTLGRQADLATCRVVVQMLNSHLQQADEHKPPTLSQEEVAKLTATLYLQPDDAAELSATVYSPLDAHYLDGCFLLRDAARSLEIAPITLEGKSARQSALDRATAGFAWVCRQVRLMPPETQAIFDMPAPPALVLRRGTGSPLERALVFLALLEQFGLDEDEAAGPQGCLVLLPGEGGQNRLWACGVAAGDGLYLFDPRLGLPLPGPGGKGVATLTQGVADPSVFGQLKTERAAYDITPDKAKAASLAVVCPLTAASPRMRFLQDKLLREKAWRGQSLPPQVRVRVAEEPSRAVATIQKAAGKSGEVTFWPPGATLLRRFLPKEEGGNDTGVPVQLRRIRGFTTDDDTRVANLPRERLFQISTVPWEEYPPIFRDPQQFRFDLGLGQQLRSYYAYSFLKPLTDPESPREHMLRGKFSTAVRELVPEPPLLLNARTRLQDSEENVLVEGLTEWVSKATAAYADQIRAKGTPDEARAKQAVETLWKWRNNDAIAVLMTGTIAGPRAAEVMYQLALCRHEPAVRFQNRFDLAASGGIALPGDAANARKTWADAESYWKEFLDANAGRPAAPAARRLRAEALTAVGQTEEARRLFEDFSGPMTELEKVAVIWLAKQLPKGG